KAEEGEGDEGEGYGEDEDAREEQGDRHREGGDEPDPRAPQPFGAQRADDRGSDPAREGQGREPDEKGRGRGENPPEDPLEGHPRPGLHRLVLDFAPDDPFPLQVEL